MSVLLLPSACMPAPLRVPFEVLQKPKNSVKTSMRFAYFYCCLYALCFACSAQSV